jgi:hypothetical protein
VTTVYGATEVLSTGSTSSTPAPFPEPHDTGSHALPLIDPLAPPSIIPVAASPMWTPICGCRAALPMPVMWGLLLSTAAAVAAMATTTDES